MKKNLIISTFITVLALFLISCDVNKDSSSSTDSTYTVTLVGSVVEATSGDPITGATIKFTDGTIVKGTVTDDNGEFSTSFDVEDDVDLVVIASKDGYASDTTSVFAIKDAQTEIPIFQLQKDENATGVGTSGGAASINLFSQSASSIGVKESGALESAEIIFEVRDSSGVLVDEEHAVDLSFTFGATPNGGEYLFPAAVTTNALGKASVTLNTGTIAGVVQIIAETSYNGKQIRSKPILIAIYGGFPVEDVFYVACEKLNYPALGIIGFNIPFTGYAGDKYHNPVRPGSSIYFTTNSGIIGGSNLTDELGTATVTFLTEPWPNDPVYGPGFFTVTASTGAEDGTTIYTNTTRLLTGAPYLTVSPASFSLENGGSQSFTYTIEDVNHNPMSSGQTVTIAVESQFIDVAGTTEVKFPDTQSKSWTQFSFVAFDTRPDTVFAETVIIEIKTTGANGEASFILSGSGR